MGEMDNGLIFHKEKLKELLSNKNFEKREKNINTNLGLGKLKISKEDDGDIRIAGKRMGSFVGLMGTGNIHSPKDGLKLNQETLIAVVSEVLFKKEYNEDFLSYFKKLVKDKEIKIEDLGLLSQIDEISINNITTGKREPTKDEVLRIAFALGLNTTELIHLLARSGYTVKPNTCMKDYILLYSIENGLKYEEFKNLYKEITFL